MKIDKVIESAEYQRAQIQLKKNRNLINEEIAEQLAWLNFQWISFLLSDEELNKVDKISVRNLKKPLTIEDIPVCTKLIYRDETFYLGQDDAGQCFSLYMDNEWIGLGTYNFNYMEDAFYLIRSRYWLGI